MLGHRALALQRRVAERAQQAVGSRPGRSARGRPAAAPAARGRRAWPWPVPPPARCDAWRCPAGLGQWLPCAAHVVVLGEQRVGAQAEGDAQLVGVEVGERARLRQHEVGDVALAGHDLLDPLVDGAGAHEAVRHDGAGLADAPRPVAGLVLDRRVPPAVVEHDVAGGGEVEAGAAGLERQHERARRPRRSGTRRPAGRGRRGRGRRGSRRSARR